MIVLYERGADAGRARSLSYCWRRTQDNATINALFDNADHDPRMGTLYSTYRDAWKASGARLIVHFENCGDYSKWGRWGALEYLEQPRADAPKFNALQSFIEQNPAWWCPPPLYGSFECKE